MWLQLHLNRFSSRYHPGACLVVEPLKRPSVDAILAMLYSIADKLGENLDGPHVSHMIVT